MDECMRGYYQSVGTGAILFAVFRGKASEGIDFADEAARLVITLGIPYPSAFDSKVVLKKNYNNLKSKIRDGKDNFTLTGSEWYSVQAFRALNQAIGRCIRHRGDWGAMIMIDSRFETDSYSKGLCKWINTRRKHFINWSDLHYNLKQFVTKHNSNNIENEAPKEIETIL